MKHVTNFIVKSEDPKATTLPLGWKQAAVTLDLKPSIYAVFHQEFFYS